jgi:NADP-dependent 3-hydroxy acid dehydrogenase YdfG
VLGRIEQGALGTVERGGTVAGLSTWFPVFRWQGSGHTVDIPSGAGREASRTASGYDTTNSASTGVRKPSARK